jgi:hypothetical protein
MACNVGAHREWHSGRAKSRTAPDDRQQAERRHKLTKELGAAGPDVVGSKENLLAEHQVRCGNPSKSTANLRGNICWHVAPGQPALPAIGQRDRWVEVRSRDWSERKNQGDKGCAGRDRVRKKRDRRNRQPAARP